MPQTGWDGCSFPQSFSYAFFGKASYTDLPNQREIAKNLMYGKNPSSNI